LLRLKQARILKGRKSVGLIIVYLVLLFCLSSVQNPHQNDVASASDTWYWVLGLLSLVYLAYVEKQRDIPFQFMNSVEPKWHYALFCFVGFTVSFIIAKILGLMFAWSGIAVYSIVVHSGNDAFGIIGYAIVVAINEESFKVALTNFFTKALGAQSKTIRSLTIATVGTSSIAVWAYLHVLFGGDSTSLAVIIFAVGIAYFLIIYGLKNYLPTTVAHAIWNAAIDFGFL